MSAINFVTLNVDTDYEIMTEYPFRIRRIGSEKHIAFTLDKSTGYLKIMLNQKKYKLHRVIAEQFIPNPEGKPCVDHIDRDKENYHLENLQWVSYSENNSNRGSYKLQENEYVDEIPESAVEIIEYNGYEYDRYWFDYNTDTIIMNTRNRFKIIKPSANGTSYAFCLCDINGKYHGVGSRKFIEEMYSRIE